MEVRDEIGIVRVKKKKKKMMMMMMMTVMDVFGLFYLICCGDAHTIAPRTLFPSSHVALVRTLLFTHSSY